MALQRQIETRIINFDCRKWRNRHSE